MCDWVTWKKIQHWSHHICQWSTSWKMLLLFSTLSKLGISGTYWDVSATSTNRLFAPVCRYLNDVPSLQVDGSCTGTITLTVVCKNINTYNKTKIFLKIFGLLVLCCKIIKWRQIWLLVNWLLFHFSGHKQPTALIV